MLQVIIAGNLGKDAVHKSTQQGKDFCSFPVAASIGWGDKKQTIWIDVTKWGEGSKGLANLLRKGSKVYIEGALSTRKWQDAQGQDKYSTEIVLQGFNSVLTMLDEVEAEGDAERWVRRALDSGESLP